MPQHRPSARAHKARVFREALGLGRSDAAWLRQALLDGLPEQEAAELAQSHFNSYREYEPGVIGIGSQPQFAIGQRALLAG